MDSGKKTVRDLFKYILTVDGEEYVKLTEVETYFNQQQELKDALTLIRTSLGQLGESFGNVQNSIGNLKGELEGVKI